jgi:hypothetical protein
MLIKGRVISLILAAAVIALSSGFGYAAVFTDPKDMSKGIKLGLTLATATAKEKSSIKAVQKMAQKEFDDWTWNFVVGNYEKLLTQNADAEIPDFRKKIIKLQEFIKKVEQVSTQLGEGKYDEVAFTAVNEAVAAFNHPLVTVLWASVKLTYESHKLVQDTKAELYIEALYGKVNNDRLLLGASSGDSPKQIQVNSETVDRFFFNYLIKDEGTRELMKPYVKIKLGQEWPELSTADWLKSFTLLGTGIDAQKDYEVEQLTEFRNVSRQWINELLKDINKQAKVEWAATRVRQQKAEFDAFAAKLKGFSPEQITEFFKNRKEMLKAKKEFPKFLSESSSVYKQLSDEFNKLKPAQVKRMQEIYSAAFGYKGKAGTYSKMALMADDLPLSNQLEAEEVNWGRFVVAISASIKDNKNNVDEAVVQDYAAIPNSDYSSDLSACYGHFSGVVPNFNFDEEPDTVYEKVNNFLNGGEFGYVAPAIDTWRSNESANAARIYHDSLIALQKAVDSAPKGAVKNARGEVVYLAGGSPYITSFTGDTNRWYISREPGYLWGPYGSNVDYPCVSSATVADEAGWAAYLSFRTQIDNEAGRMNELAGAFASLAKRRAEELAALRDSLNKIYPELDVRLAFDDNKPLLANIKNKPSEIAEAEDFQKYLKDNVYTYIGNLNEKGYGLVSIDAYMEQKAAEIESIANKLDEYANYLENKYPVVIRKWSKGLNDWLELKKPDNDTVNQFLVLVDKQFDNDREVLSMDARAGVIQSSVGMLPGMVNNFVASAKTEISNRTTDSDYLKAMAVQWRTWLNLQMENGTFERNYLPTGIPVTVDNYDGDLRIKGNDNIRLDFTNGMLIVQKPYFHYATAKELATLPQLQKAKQDLQKFKVYSFISSKMPFYASKLDSLLSGKNLTPAKEDNFFVNNFSKMVVYKSNLDKVSKLLPYIDPGADGFIDKLKEVSALLPGTIIAQTPEEVKEEIEKKGGKYSGKYYEFSKMADIDRSQYSGFEMGSKYLELADKISVIIDKRREYLLKKAQKKAEEQSALERARYYNDEINRMNKEISELPESSITVEKTNRLYTDFYQLQGSYKNEKLSGLDASFKALEESLVSLKSRTGGIENQKVQQVKDLYASFKQAYESRNDSQLMSLMSDGWEAGDGTTLSDLQQNLARSFRVFDEVRYNIQKLVVNKIADRRYAVSYEVTITGRIYARNIKHEEKSSINEEVNLDDSGRPRITRTLNGRFWYVE